MKFEFLLTRNKLNVNFVGSTTLYSRLKADLDIFSRIRNLNDSQETSPSPLKLVDDNCYQICGINLQNTCASIWHGSTKQNQSAMMYAHCGAVSNSSRQSWIGSIYWPGPLAILTPLILLVPSNTICNSVRRY